MLKTEEQRNKEAEKPSVMLIHGFSGNPFDTWGEILPSLFDNNFSIITPEVVGHFNYFPRELNEYQIEREAERFKVMIGDRQVHLLGYSMGGRLALTIAVHYPEKVKSLILESATAGLKTEAERQERIQADNALADKIEANGIEWFAEYWGNLPLWANQSPEQKAALYQQRLKNSPLGLANSLRGMGTGQMPPLWDALPQLKMPVKLIVGELDKKFLAINQEMAALIPNAELSIVPNAGHAVHIEAPEAYTAIIKNFLKNRK
jgi:2-succinyl-6-hydroxy-2,4-cyclohexadiene-1-carboxylate synthase